VIGGGFIGLEMVENLVHRGFEVTRPDATLAKTAGIETGEREGIHVDEQMRTGDPDIFAVGDAVEVNEKLPESWLPKSGKSVYKPNTDPASSLVASAYTLIDVGTAKVNKKGGPLKRDREGGYATRFIHAFNVNFVHWF